MAHLGSPELGHSPFEIEQQSVDPRQDYIQRGYQQAAFGNSVPSFTLPSSQSLMNINPDMQMQFSGKKAGWLNNMNTNTDSYKNMYGGGGGSGLFTAENMNAFGSAIGGLGQLASGWAALKNMGLQRDAYDTMKNQWERNYGDQTTVANNMIADRNAWRNANNMTTTANYVGGQAPGKNYAG